MYRQYKRVGVGVLIDVIALNIIKVTTIMKGGPRVPTPPQPPKAPAPPRFPPPRPYRPSRPLRPPAPPAPPPPQRLKLVKV